MRVVSRGIFPRGARIEHLIRYARHVLRHVQPEHRLSPRRYVVQLSRQRRPNHGACALEVHAMADAVGAARPTGVHQPAFHLVSRDALAQHLGVHAGTQGQEWRAEARRKRLFRFRHSAFRARHLGGIARQEMVHRLLRRQLRDRRHHSERIAREEDDVVGMSGHSFGDMVRDVMNRIRCPRILGDPLGIEVHGAGLGIHVDVFQHGPEHLGRGVDLGLTGARQPDDLGVAATLEVEDALIRPPMFVVADQPAFRIRGKGGLARAGQPEEQRAVTLLPDVGGAVHREHALQRQQVVEDAEDRFLELACVARAADQNRALCEAHDDERPRLGSVDRRIGVELGCMKHLKPRRKARQLAVGGAQEHVVDEEGVPGVGRDEANRQPERRIRPRVHVADEELLRGEVRCHVGPEALELVGRDRLVHLAPPDLCGGVRLLNEKLVVGAAAGVGCSHRRERSP